MQNSYQPMTFRLRVVISLELDTWCFVFMCSKISVDIYETINAVWMALYRGFVHLPWKFCSVFLSRYIVSYRLLYGCVHLPHMPPDHTTRGWDSFVIVFIQIIGEIDGFKAKNVKGYPDRWPGTRGGGGTPPSRHLIKIFFFWVNPVREVGIRSRKLLHHHSELTTFDRIPEWWTKVNFFRLYFSLKFKLFKLSSLALMPRVCIK